MRILLVLCFAAMVALGIYAADLRTEVAAARVAVQTAQDAERQAAAEVEPLRRRLERVNAEREEDRAAVQELVTATRAKVESTKDAKAGPGNVRGAAGQAAPAR